VPARPFDWTFPLAEPIRVALCDDHAVVRSGLRRILSAEDGIEVVGEAGNAADAVALAVAVSPDVFVMDLGLPGVNGIDATRQVRDASPATAVLVLTVHDDVAYLRKAFDAGARGYLVKDAADVELVLAVRRVAAGDEYVHPSLGAALLAQEATTARPSGPGGELSEREVDVLRMVALGHTNADIAEELYVSVRTVETHRAHVQQKLGLKARADLVRVAREFGLIDDDLRP
jgi:two-component system response regulator NreC